MCGKEFDENGDLRTISPEELEKSMGIKVTKAEIRRALRNEKGSLRIN